jgi:hypothetical protein
VENRAGHVATLSQRVGVAILTLGAVGAVLWLAFGLPRTGSSRVASPNADGTISFAVEGLTPAASLEIGGRTHVGVLGNFCWEQSAEVQLCADSFLEGPTEFLPVEGGEVLAVETDAHEMDIQIGHGGPPGEAGIGMEPLDTRNGTITLSSEPGIYLLSLVGTWPQGWVPAYFGFQVGPEESAATA